MVHPSSVEVGNQNCSVVDSLVAEGILAEEGTPVVVDTHSPAVEVGYKDYWIELKTVVVRKDLQGQISVSRRRL